MDHFRFSGLRSLTPLLNLVILFQHPKSQSCGVVFPGLPPASMIACSSKSILSSNGLPSASSSSRSCGRVCSVWPWRSFVCAGSRLRRKMFRSVRSSHCSMVSFGLTLCLELGLSTPSISLFCGVTFAGVVLILMEGAGDGASEMLIEGVSGSVGVAS